jgi:hypothetical protein
MTSATMRRARGASQGEGYWMIVFAVALLVTVGFFNLIDGIAAIAVLAGSQAARWFAVVVISLNAISQMFFIPAYPFWSLLIIAVDIVALWGLCAYGSRENLEAAA